MPRGFNARLGLNDSLLLPVPDAPIQDLRLRAGGLALAARRHRSRALAEMSKPKKLANATNDIFATRTRLRRKARGAVAAARPSGGSRAHASDIAAMRPAAAPARAAAVSAPGTGHGGRIPATSRASATSRVGRRPRRDVPVARVPRRRPATAAAAVPRDDASEVTEPIPWADRRDVDAPGALPNANERGDATLEDAAFFVGWRVVHVRTGEDIGEVREALGMASGEVVAQLGHSDEEDDDDDDGWTVEVDPFSDGHDDYYDDDGHLDEDEEDGFEVIYEDASASASYEYDGDEYDGDEYDGDEDGDEDDEYDGDEDDEQYAGEPSAPAGPPPMSLVLRVRGHRDVAGAGGVTNKEPITHLIPLARAIFPRWNPDTRTLAADPPFGLLDLGARQSKIRGLRRDLQPYCSRVAKGEQGMPKKTALARAGREDLIERIDELGGWYEAAAQLGLRSNRKPNGYWENLDFLRDELLQLIYAFWFQEEDEDTGERMWYNDISGALTYEEPDVASGGGLDTPVMPSISDIQEAKRYDLQHAIIFHGGFIEVAEQLGWMQKRYGENRHLLSFARYAEEMRDFIEEMGEDAIPRGRLPTLRMMLDEDREDLVNAARWHGGMWEIARRMRMQPYAASALSRLPDAARAIREFALEEQGLEAGDAGPLMPSHEFIVSRGRHDLGRAYYLHGRTRLADAAGLELRTRRYTYEECRRFMRVEVKPRVRNSTAFRRWRESGSRPRLVPADPAKYYGETGEWVDWAHFLGVRVKPGDPEARIRATPFLEYEDAKRRVRAARELETSKKSSSKASGSLGTDDDAFDVPTTSSEYRRWRGKPPCLPRFPEGVYGRRGEWRGWDDFLGRDDTAVRETDETDDTAVRRDGSTGQSTRESARRRRRRARHASYQDARAAMHALARSGEAPRTSKQFQLWRLRPSEIPPNPRATYLRTGEWAGWDDFLGREVGEVLARGVVSSRGDGART